MRMLRRFHAVIAVLLPAVSGTLLCLLIWLLSGQRRKALNVMGRFIGRFGLALAGIRLQVTGLHHVDAARPAVFIFNHQSGLDPILVCRLIETDITGVAKRELANNPVLGPLLRLADTLFVDRDAPEPVSLEPVIKQMREGLSVAVAPEGTRRHQPPVGHFRSGAFRIAIACKRPIVPIVIRDAYQRLAPFSRELTPGLIHIDILEPVWPEHFPPTADELAQQLEDRYRNLLSNQIRS